MIPSKSAQNVSTVHAYYHKFMYVVAIIAPATNIPQFLEVWVYRNAAGVSVLSWALFASVSVAWLIYGLFHEEKIMIIMSTLLLIMQSAIAFGAFLYG